MCKYIQYVAERGLSKGAADLDYCRPEQQGKVRWGAYNTVKDVKTCTIFYITLFPLDLKKKNV